MSLSRRRLADGTPWECIELISLYFCSSNYADAPGVEIGVAANQSYLVNSGSVKIVPGENWSEFCYDTVGLMSNMMAFCCDSFVLC
jgi:hypothetical protein